LEQRIQEIFPALRYMTRRDGEIAQLTRTLADRDGQVTGLKEALAGREFENARLTQAIAERDGRIAEIESATKTQNQRIAQQETDLSNLAAEKNRLLQERDRCVAQLTTERDALVQEGAQLSVKNAELAERYETQTSILREKDLQLKQHKLEQEHLNSELFRLGSVVQYQNMTLDQVYGSFGWLVTSKFRTLKDRYFFVPGSWRRRLYDSILAMVKRRFRNGRSMPNSSNSL
jgi:chromosome segregation ATPase